MRLKITTAAIERLAVKQRPYEAFDTEQRGLLFRVEPTGSRSFYFAYRVGGRRRRFRIGAYPGVTVARARKIALMNAGNVAAGKDPQQQREQERASAERDRVSSLKAFLTSKYEPWALAHLKTADQQLKRIRADFAAWLDKPMSSLSPFLIEGWRRSELRRGKKAVTVNRDIQRLRAAVAKAVEWGVLERHPFNAVKPLKTDVRGRVRYLSREEERALRHALVQRETSLRSARVRFNAWRRARNLAEFPERGGEFVDHIRPMVLLALNTGMRRGELLSLQWRNVNLGAKTVSVAAENAKSGQTRYIPLNAEALGTLQRWRDGRVKVDTDDFVFTTAKNRRLTTITHGWETVVRLAKIEGFRFHDLRHTFASWLVMAAVPLNTVRELLGHTSLEMTLRYSHLAPDNLAAAVEKLAS